MNPLHFKYTSAYEKDLKKCENSFFFKFLQLMIRMCLGLLLMTESKRDGVTGSLQMTRPPMYTQCSRLNLNTNHVSQHFFLFLQVSNKPSYVNLYEKFKIDGGFSHKTQILPMGKNFQEIGQKYKQICING